MILLYKGVGRHFTFIFVFYNTLFYSKLNEPADVTLPKIVETYTGIFTSVKEEVIFTIVLVN